MANDGISEISNEETWLLDGGKCVVEQCTNCYLNDFSENNKCGSEQVIGASMTINDNVTDQHWCAEQLKKKQQNITSIVRDGNRRKMQSKGVLCSLFACFQFSFCYFETAL
jgi:hypothetical protein